MTQDAVLRMRRNLSPPIPPVVLPDGLTLRTLAVKADKRLLKSAHAVLTVGYWEGGGGAPVFAKWWKALRTDSEFDPSLVFVAMSGADAVGVAQCWTSNFVKDLAVIPAARRRGIGKTLMLQAFHAFAQRGALHVDLKVRAENAIAIALYTSLGMNVVERLPA